MNLIGLGDGDGNGNSPADTPMRAQRGEAAGGRASQSGF